MNNEIDINQMNDVLRNAFESICSIPVWIPNSLEIANRKSIEAQTFINYLESKLFKSYQAYITGVDVVSGFELFDRFLWLLKKHKELSAPKSYHGMSINDWKKYFKKLCSMKVK
jgi:hypothetical protein